MTAPPDRRRVWRSVGLILALVALNASLAFVNVWPTPAVRWRGDVSVELCALVLALAVGSVRFDAVPDRVIQWISAFWVVLIVGRYADVTAPALYGRPVNLYWDSRHVSAVVAMLARVASWWAVLLVSAAAFLLPLCGFLIVRWALGQVVDAMRRPREREGLAALASLLLLLFVGQRFVPRLPHVPRFARPVTESYGRQARLLAVELTGVGRTTTAPAPAFESSLSRVRGADVFLMFIESYGAVSFDNPAFANALASSRQRFVSDIETTGRDVVSAYVESPTFGGSSWLAHVSLLSGVEVRDEDTDAVLMAQKRDTMVTVFARRGFRTIAVMPGLQQAWPEGAFYGFDEIYDAKRLDYHGPPFGWWILPDQFTVARMDALEVNKQRRAPLFVFFPTTGTHTPFTPTAPYQADWTRLLTSHPYDEADVERAWQQEPDWLHLAPSYVRALAAAYTWLGGYLRLRADRDFVMILIGDHQPPAAVSGQGASWEVPVHVIASRPDILGALRSRGFRSGLTPAHPPLSRMHALSPILFDALGDPE